MMQVIFIIWVVSFLIFIFFGYFLDFIYNLLIVLDVS